VQDRAADRVEEQVADPRATEGLGQVGSAPRMDIASVLFDAVGVGQLSPVGGDAREVVEAQRARLLHEERLVALERLDDARRACRGECRQVGCVDVARGPRRVSGGHLAQTATEADASPCRGMRHAGSVGEPRRAGTGPVGRPRLPRIPCARQSGRLVIDAVLEPAQLDQQRAELGVAQRAGVDGGELVDSGAKRLQHTHIQTYIRGIKKWIN
jgi:hypothetical protein